MAVELVNGSLHRHALSALPADVRIDARKAGERVEALTMRTDSTTHSFKHRHTQKDLRRFVSRNRSDQERSPSRKTSSTSTVGSFHYYPEWVFEADTSIKFAVRYARYARQAPVYRMENQQLTDFKGPCYPESRRGTHECSHCVPHNDGYENTRLQWRGRKIGDSPLCPRGGEGEWVFSERPGALQDK